VTKITKFRDDGNARLMKKVKGSVSVNPRDKMEPLVNMKSLKVGGDSKKKKKPGVLLYDAVTEL
jgi:hypothetical protein